MSDIDSNQIFVVLNGDDDYIYGASFESHTGTLVPYAHEERYVHESLTLTVEECERIRHAIEDYAPSDLAVDLLKMIDRINQDY